MSRGVVGACSALEIAISPTIRSEFGPLATFLHWIGYVLIFKCKNNGSERYSVGRKWRFALKECD